MIYELIDSLNKEESRNLKIFLNRTNSEVYRKDIALFDYVRKNYPNLDENDICNTLYKGKNKNALYRLKNRLHEDINKSINLLYYNSSEYNQSLYFLLLAKHYQGKRHQKLTFYYLKKSEKKAQDLLSYDLLDIIYSEYIRFSQETLSINPEVFIEKRKQNRIKLERLREIDDVLSVLIYRIRKSQNFSVQNKQIIALLEKTISDFSESVDIKNSPHLRFKIYHAVSRILLQKHDYVSLEEYLLLTLDEFKKENLFHKNNHDTKLQLLTYLTNCLFKNKKYEESLRYSEELNESMKEYDAFLYKKYLFYYYNSLVNNYTVIDKEKAISILQDALLDETMKKVAPHSAVIFNLNLSLQYFDKSEYKLANKCLVKLKLDDNYTQLDNAFKLKIAVVELIIRFELEDYDYIEYQIDTIKKGFSQELKQKEYFRQRDILIILKKMIYVQKISDDQELLKRIKNLIHSMETEKAGDNDILNYNEWLELKIA